MSATSRFVTLSSALSSALVAMAALCAPSVATAAPTLRHAQDLGATPAAQTVTASLVLKVRNPAALEAFVAQTQEPGPNYHRFLSVNEFTQQFAPSQGDISAITHYLHQYGITVTEVYADRLLI